MIVDDTPEVADVIAEYVRKLGHNVSVCYSAHEGRERLRVQRMDVALVDVNLDEGSGFTILDEFKPANPELQFIMISGDQSVESPVKAMRLGAAGYMIKPLGFDAFGMEFERVRKERESMLERRDNLRRLENELQMQTQDFLAEVGTSFNLQKTLITSLCNLARARDKDTGEHLYRIANYCREIAIKLRANPRHESVIDDAFINRMMLAAPLHDIGKTGIPDAILLKPGALSPDELTIMKRHTLIGKEILEEVVNGFDGNAPEVVLMGMDICAYHHERWDGKGYPVGLAGDEIPLSARIVSLADFYDALASSRIYRVQAYDHESIASMIRKEAGSRFDPEVVHAFFEAEPQVMGLRLLQSPEQMQTAG
ncbi:MAG: HD domain-containing phosphohydrolase [Candidatus Sumerlaeota bacterium]